MLRTVRRHLQLTRAGGEEEREAGLPLGPERYALLSNAGGGGGNLQGGCVDDEYSIALHSGLTDESFQKWTILS